MCNIVELGPVPILMAFQESSSKGWVLDIMMLGRKRDMGSGGLFFFVRLLRIYNGF
jgi:hypothetical protein